MHIIPSFPRLRAAARAAVAPVLAAFALAAFVLLAAPAPALAHDALEGSSPASGATAATAPEEIRLDFSERPLGVGAEVRVTDPSGTSWSEGSPEVVDRSIHQKLRAGAPAGQYTVVWRVVSSDSHPIEGTFGYTVAQGSTTPAAVPGASSSPSAAAPGIQASQPGTVETPAPAPTAQNDFPWMIVVFAVVAVGLLAALGIGARRRLARGDEENNEESDEASEDRGA
jgi:methionine-rich copper-binding protein CopC